MLRMEKIGLIHTTGAAGVRAASAAGRGALGDGTPIRMGVKKGQHARGIISLAFLAGDRGIGLAERAQDIKLCTAIEADVFVKGHSRSYL